jgi:alkylhydroperoxidase family enzyme
MEEHRRVTGGRHSSEIEKLMAAALSGPGRTGSDLRRAVAGCAATFAGGAADRASDVPKELASLVDKAARHAYQVTDSDLEALKDAGYSDDQLFEIVIAVAIGAALGRLDVGLNALHGVRS